MCIAFIKLSPLVSDHYPLAIFRYLLLLYFHILSLFLFSSLLCVNLSNTKDFLIFFQLVFFQVQLDLMLFTFKWQNPWVRFSIKVIKKASEFPVAVKVCVKDIHGICKKSRRWTGMYWLGCVTDVLPNYSQEISSTLHFIGTWTNVTLSITLLNSESIDREMCIFSWYMLFLWLALLFCKTIPTPKILQ